MSFNEEIYIQLKDCATISNESILKIRDAAAVLASEKIKEDLLNIELLHIDSIQQDYAILSVLTVIDKIKAVFPNLTVISVGVPEILIKVEKEQKKEKDMLAYGKLAVVGATLFVGTGLAIMNFHADVNMREAHKVLYQLITGIEESRPLILQIPYSLGIGLGMALFFNHVFPKRNNEPSPMEVEMYLYKKNMDQYLLDYEENTAEKKR
ncbi:stage V sporulation protein AA [Thermotalea metallivorans]|uniref:Stage V sporulation protein AA domain-containing protein n=1 Tax=Thermotalea metallivorans TaxID=520762 RepID=A0A140L0Y6_9FIRM|nr:stage V sporulation protein AA [Thermotalea metallivorans]KXG74211.1 hypothetical protein AN619_25290 [Thermotalea metallivorans]